MHPATIELMHEQVRLIYRAATGTELTEADLAREDPTAMPSGDIEHRFAELEALVRRIPELDERVPPFSFAPPVDVTDAGRSLVVEIAAPGVCLDDVRVETRDGELVVSGVRRGGNGSNGHGYVRAEIPRGPFRRAIPLPCAIEGSPRLEVREGVIAIHLQKVLVKTKERASPTLLPATEMVTETSESA